MTAIGGILALAVGFVLGLLGGGGSVLTVPILIYALHVPVKLAIATSLFVVGMVAFIGFITHVRQRTVAVKVAMIFAPFAVVTSYASARISKHVPPHVQLVLFALVGLIGSVMMFRGTFRKSSGPDTYVYEFKADRRTIVLLALGGIGVGILTGLIGVGGGFLIVPALVLVEKLPMRLAIGTSLLVISMNAMAGFAGYAGAVPIDWYLVAWFTGVAAVGSILGTLMSKRVPQQRLRQVFGVLLIGVSLYVLYRR
ncbi:MAG TPA: sulfite exporter TauE/SafE family protein [Gemmatimonadaceae bacterium]|nr:sulfite exporter TauE/SafE family protein [Gemmatimonadaceae bacterium]